MDERIYTKGLTGSLLSCVPESQDRSAPFALVDRVAGIITRYSMLAPGDRVGVAVSGGADSVVLLHVLCRLSKQLQIQNPLILHANHQLRGAESNADEDFVRSLAASLGLHIVVAQFALENGNLEESARVARREFFRMSQKQHGLAKVALGHTLSDQAETVLFRIFRGSGLAGLAGMRMTTQDRLIRPLLTTKRLEVREWAKAEGIAWREDSSNLDARYSRNRLRHVTIPSLEKDYNPNLESVLAGMAQVAQSEEEYWSQQIEEIYPEITKRTQLGLIFQIADLSGLHVAVQRRLIRRSLLDLRGHLRGIDLPHVDGILGICGSERGHDRILIPGADALRSYGQLLLMCPGRLRAEARGYSLNLRPGEKLQLPGGQGSISINWVNPNAPNCANFKEETTSETADLDGDALFGQGSPGTLAVRNWEPGDELQRPGHIGAEKIKSLFQEYRVLLWERRHWPVLVSDAEIVWTRQFGSALKFKGSDHTQKVIRLTYQASR